MNDGASRLDGGIRVVSAPFGGILVETALGGIAVNGGGTPDEMDGFYLAGGRPPAAIVLTTEHMHRSRGVAEFAERHGVTLVGSLIATSYLHLKSPERWEVLPPRRMTVEGIRLDLFNIRYDSLDPFALTVTVNDETVGIVPDGRLRSDDADALARLRNCRKLFLANKLDRPPEMPRSLYLRYRGSYNSSEELAELFQDYRGELVIDPNCR